LSDFISETAERKIYGKTTVSDSHPIRVRVRVSGGVCAYIRNDIKCEVLDYSNRDRRIEILWLKCYFNCHVYYVACCYHPPNPKYEPSLFTDQLINDIEQGTGVSGSNNSVEFIILLGDFNTLDCHTLEIQCGLTQVVKQPTHGGGATFLIRYSQIDQIASQAAQSRCTVVRPIQKSIGKWEI